ncbi:hypothetical protein SRHO_G00080520 [Serrasalmus rhombeus]
MITERIEKEDLRFHDVLFSDAPYQGVPAAAKKRTADRHGGVADVVVALTDGVMPPPDEKALTDAVPESHSAPAWRAVTTAATSETDGSSWFVLIDSHARNARGEEEDGDSGTSSVAYHANMESLLNRVTILGPSLSAERAPFEISGGVATVADAGSELETHDEHAENEPRQLGDVSQRGVKRSRGQFLYRDAVKGKWRAPDAERVSVVNNESKVSADDRAERFSRSTEPLVSAAVLI